MPKCLTLLCLLMLLYPILDAADKSEPRPLSSSKALKLVRSYLSETDETKKTAMLEEAAHTPASFKIIRKALIQRGYPGMKPGVHQGLELPLPTTVSDKPATFAVQVPSSYKGRKLWPLVIGLHGGGNGTGSGDQHVGLLRGIDDAILVCPTSVDLGIKYYWRNPKNEEMLALLIKKMKEIFPIDPDRVYLTGYSMGGIGVYYLAPRLNERFAAVSPGGGSWKTVFWPQLLNTPVYLLHGKQDMRGKRFTDFPNAENAAKCLEEAGCPYELRAVDCGHRMIDSEQATMVEWLLKQKRNPYPKRIVHASPCAKDFMVPLSPSPPDRWLQIDSIGDEKLERMHSVSGGGLDLKKTSVNMGILDATWVDENKLEITASNVKAFTVRLAEQLVDFEEPLRITVNDKIVFEEKVSSSLPYAMQYADEHRDLSMIFVGEVQIEL